MNRPLVTFSLVALLSAAVLAVLYLRVGNAKTLLETQLIESTARSDKFSRDLNTATEQNGALNTKITVLDADIGATKGKLATAESRAAQLDRDLAQAKNLLSLQEQNTRALTAEVTSLKADLADARSTNAPPEVVAGYKNTIAELERQLASAGNGAAAPSAAGSATAVFASRPGRATVLNVGPESAFVVLDFGDARGAQLGQRLTINHGTDPVATVLISDVRTNFSVAQVQPDTLQGVLQKGDLALLIREP